MARAKANASQECQPPGMFVAIWHKVSSIVQIKAKHDSCQQFYMASGAMLTHAII